MATSNVTPEMQQNAADPSKFVGKVTTKVENPKTGEEIELTADYLLPLAQNINEAYSMVNGNEADVLFWFNHGRKIMARYLALQSLDADFGKVVDPSDQSKEIDLNALYNTLRSARAKLSDKNTSKERLAAITNFIISEDKFAPLAKKLSEFQPENKSIVFGLNKDSGETELTKPSGVRGRKKKESDEESESESE